MKIKMFTLTVFTAIALSACNSDENSDTTDSNVHGHIDERVVFYYSPTSKDHYAYDMHEDLLIDLDSPSYNVDGEEYNISNFNLSSSDTAYPYRWVDDKGDNNESTDEEKVVMFKSTYDFDTNASYEDFFYMAYIHEDDVERHLEVHASADYNVTSGVNFDELSRLHAYIIDFNQLKSDINSSLSSSSSVELCALFEHEDHEHNETLYYAMDRNGTLHIFEDNTSNEVQTVVISSTCDSQSVGISGIENGISIYLGGSDQTIYEVDKHDENDIHVHETFDVTSYIGSGAEAEMMVGISPAEEDHDH